MVHMFLFAWLFTMCTRNMKPLTFPELFADIFFSFRVNYVRNLRIWCDFLLYANHAKLTALLCWIFFSFVRSIDLHVQLSFFSFYSTTSALLYTLQYLRMQRQRAKKETVTKPTNFYYFENEEKDKIKTPHNSLHR